MSADNYNMIIQLENGKWIMSPNHSLTHLMNVEEEEAYKRARSYARLEDTQVEYATEAEAWEAADKEPSEHGTFSHRRPEWIRE